ncbi:hypothetical protein [Hymenobacter swuensis]|uniref:Secreted protein n=1 Tax=Hymenobacter swuensis DY53 TaxID=1227739 RepID=W8EZ73_9BACT|nr:hypothetical protein [Hymenobacter swuensis]AHJ95656.1 hypothetical protein Hsw_0061 [Hymenobacter swuensis DY53]
MLRPLALVLLLTGLVGSAAQAQNRPPVRATRHHPTERISPVPGVTLPSGVGQGKAEPLPVATDVQPNGVLVQPKLPTGEVTVDSIEVTPAEPRRPAKPTPARRKRP